MEKTINLEEIAKKSFLDEESGFSFESHYSITQKCTLKAMKEAIRQALELAADNADMECSNYKTKWYEKYYHIDEHTDIVVNKQSILDTINQIV